MIQISKLDRYGLEKKGLKMNKDIYHTYSSRKHYYLVEDSRNLKLLDRVRKERLGTKK